MNCPNCKAEMPESAKFCGDCGARMLAISDGKVTTWGEICKDLNIPTITGQCKVCEALELDGAIEHDKSCFDYSSDGGGTEYVGT